MEERRGGKTRRTDLREKDRREKTEREREEAGEKETGRDKEMEEGRAAGESHDVV